MRIPPPLDNAKEESLGMNPRGLKKQRNRAKNNSALRVDKG